MDILSRIRKKEIKKMHSERYQKARKEHVNCLAMSIVCLGIPLYNAFRIWKPIMKEELEKEKLPDTAQDKMNQQ